MRVEIINTGSELMLGRVLNTHQQWICRQLSDRGYAVARQICIADDPVQIQEAVRESLSRADLVITTGGLGPTSDDMTRDLIAQLLNLQLMLDSETLAGMQRYFAGRSRKMPDSAKVQALIPEGARILANGHGTAPGLAIEAWPNPFRADGARSWLILLPGPPRELRPMFLESVVPLLAKELPPREEIVSLTLKTTGLGESFVEGKIAGPLQKFTTAGLELGYCARIGEVEVRLTAHGNGAANLVHEAEAVTRGILGRLIFAVGDETLESTVVRLLTERSKTVALAESCTGGMIANRLTDVPGASVVLKCGMVTYSNEAKQSFLGVTAAALEEHGAVSEVVARQMAEGARQRCLVDYAIAVTGIAGPGGGTPAKPVGTVYIALASEKETVAQRHLNSFDRPTFKSVTSQQALDLLRCALD